MGREIGQQAAAGQVVDRGRQRMRARGNQFQLTGWRQSGRVGRVPAVSDRLFQRCDADHEELVQVARRNRGESRPLEQRRRRVGRLLEHALVERQP